MALGSGSPWTRCLGAGGLNDFFHHISTFLAKFWGIDPPGLGLLVLVDRSPWTMCLGAGGLNDFFIINQYF